MTNPPASPRLAALRARIGLLEAGPCAQGPARTVLPFGVAAIDMRLPGGGLALGSLHEVAGGSGPDDAAAALFTAGIAARIGGTALWCVTRQDLFAPALAQAGLAPERVVFAEAGDEKTLLACCEEGLRHGGPATVVAEVARLSMAASRRLQLAAESSGATAIALRRSYGTARVEAAAEPSTGRTRWKISARPSAPLPVAGVGRARWHVQLLRCRGGEGADFEMEACDGEGRLAVPAEMVHGSPRPAAARAAGRA